MKASACVATAEKKAEESGEEREKQLGTTTIVAHAIVPGLG